MEKTTLFPSRHCRDPCALLFAHQYFNFTVCTLPKQEKYKVTLFLIFPGNFREVFENIYLQTRFSLSMVFLRCSTLLAVPSHRTLQLQEKKAGTMNSGLRVSGYNVGMLENFGVLFWGVPRKRNIIYRVYIGVSLLMAYGSRKMTMASSLCSYRWPCL